MLISDSFTIIDEADEMMHGDWEEEMSKIMGGGGQSTLFFLLEL